MFHVCWNNQHWSFLCPNGTIFDQQTFTCVWWNQFDCSTAPTYYFLNKDLFVPTAPTPAPAAATTVAPVPAPVEAMAPATTSAQAPAYVSASNASSRK